MAKTVVGLFDAFNQAENVVRELEERGYQPEDVNIVAIDAAHVRPADRDTKPVFDSDEAAAFGAAAGAGVGGTTGAVLGGLTGLLAGLGALVIPGFGPIIAAGPLVAALTGAGIGAATGAGAGALIGGLVGVGVPEDQAGYYAEGVRRGGTLVIVRATDVGAREVEDLMRRHGAVDIEERAGEWRRQGWTDDAANRSADRTAAVASEERRPVVLTDQARTADIADIDANMPEQTPELGIRTDDGRPVSTRPYGSPGDVEP